MRIIMKKMFYIFSGFMFFFMTLNMTAILCAQDAPSKAQAYLLRYKWVKGQTLTWDVVHRNRTTTTITDTRESVDTYSHSDKVWKIEDVDENGAATVTNSVPWADMREKTGDKPIRVYDSRLDTIPPDGFETVPESLNRPLARIKLDTRGNMLERTELRPTTIIQQANTAYVCFPLPEKAIPVGYSWTHQYPVYVPQETGNLQRVEMLQKYTLESVENDMAVITYSTRILTPLTNQATRAQIMERQYTGNFMLDVKNGRPMMTSQKVDESCLGFRGQASSIKMLIEFNEKFKSVESDPKK